MGVPDKPRGARYWAREWGVHHHTARKLLRHIRKHYGAKAVWQVGPQRALVATSASLQVCRVLRAERNLILVLDAAPGGPQPAPLTRRRLPDPDEDPGGYVTEEQHSRAISELWRAVERLGGRAR